MKAFGPVPSRRLGQSLGVNNIPPKVCTYSCVYCQIGKTEELTTKRRAFYRPEDLAGEVREKVAEAKKRQTRIDYLSFVPDGEPTLDINLGKNIELLRPMGIKVAVLTNGSLINLKDVQEDLAKADLVSLKIDAATVKTWRRIDRPHKSLDLKAIQDGMQEFARGFKGELITETMLLKGINDADEEIQKIAHFLARLKPLRSYISIPTRPTAMKGVLPASDEALTIAYHIFDNNIPVVEYLMGYEGDEFGYSGNLEEDLLGITSVHPMREESVREYLNRAGADWKVIADLLERGSLRKVEYQGRNFYLGKFHKKS
ncbi:MAG: radical SAM protein [Deltaproteobacteria bacterium]|nr:MAG: radical SAM protein [Deltaproteobacteria bacterium]